RISLRPGNCRATSEAIEAIRKADAVVLGPGSLYTSIIPNLLVGNIYRELIASKAIKVYVCNVMTQKGETDGYKASDHMRAIIDHTAAGIINYCIVNTARISADMLKKYEGEYSYPVVADIENLKKLKAKAVEAHIISTKDYVRHDSVRLAKIIIDLVTSLKKEKN
ncbi:MAG: YvcK family protein, partial [Candidatus Omnitrophica bacterium]|nr:YvcK family protein [Candidatus Omnitrophota bacterium]